MWKTTNYSGKEVIWYSQEEVKETVDSLLKVQYQLADSCKKYKQTLAEIEKLAIQGNTYCIDYNVDDCEKCIKQSDCKTKLFKQILQKINDLEDDNTRNF